MTRRGECSDVVASDGAPPNGDELQLGPRGRDALDSVENIGDVVAIACYDGRAYTCSPVQLAMIGFRRRYRELALHFGDHRPDHGAFLFE